MPNLRHHVRHRRRARLHAHAGDSRALLQAQAGRRQRLRHRRLIGLHRAYAARHDSHRRAVRAEALPADVDRHVVLRHGVCVHLQAAAAAAAHQREEARPLPVLQRRALHHQLRQLEEEEIHHMGHLHPHRALRLLRALRPHRKVHRGEVPGS